MFELLANLDERLSVLAVEHGAMVYLVLGLIAFSQTGLVLGPAIPGNTLLFTAGMLAGGRDPVLGLAATAGALIAGGVAGNYANYGQGVLLGRTVFEKREKGLVSKEGLAKTDAFFEKHGRLTMLLSPFVPFVRSFAPFVAGVGRMPLGSYSLWGALGVLAWVGAMLVAGSVLGQVPWVRENLGLAVLVLFVVVSAQIGLAVMRKRRRALEAGV